MPLTTYTKNRLAKWVANVQDMPAKTTRYLALHDDDPGATGAANEAAGGSYGRQAIAWTDNTGTNPGEVYTSAPIDFSNMPAGDWTYGSVWDAATSGNCLYYGPLLATKTTGAGDNAHFDAGDVIFRSAA